MNTKNKAPSTSAPNELYHPNQASPMPALTFLNPPCPTLPPLIDQITFAEPPIHPGPTDPDQP